MNRRNRALVALLCLVAGLYLLATIFTRYAADDYCDYAKVSADGVIHLVTNQYQTWSGRYSYYLAAGLARYIDPIVSGVVPFVVLVLFGAMLSLLTSPRLALLLLLATLGTAPNLFQSSYWVTGTLTYTLPLALLCLNCWMIMRGKSSAAIALTAFATAGLSETAGIAQCIVLAFAWLTLPCYRRKVGYALLGAIVGMAIVVAAPGNAVRRSYFPQVDIVEAAYRSALNSFKMFADALKQNLFAILALAAVAFTSCPVRISKSQIKRCLLALLVMMFCVNAACMFASYYSTSSPLADRARIIPNFITFVGLSLLAWLASGLFRWRPTERTVQALVFVAAVVMLIQSVAFMRSMQNYAAAWDTRRASGNLYPIEAFGLEDMGTDWVYGCAKQVYP